MTKKKTTRTLLALLTLALAAAVPFLLPQSGKAALEPIAICVESSSFSTANTGDALASTLLQIGGHASVTADGILRLTQNTTGQAGVAVRRDKIQITEGLSTYFQLKMHQGSAAPADGMAFMIYKSDTIQVGAFGGGLGYGGIPNSYIVEFDTYQNGDAGDPAGYHFAIMKDGDSTHTSQPYVLMPELYGNNINVWVEYNGSTGKLTVTAGTGATRGDSANKSQTRNVGTELAGNPLYAGFSGSTGGSYEYHDVNKWYLQDKFVSTGLLSTAGTYTQAASRTLITLDRTPDPRKATITLYDAAGNLMAGAGDIYVDGTLVQAATAIPTTGYEYSLTSLDVGSHTIKVLIAGGATDSETFTSYPESPAITAQPENQTKFIGQTATFSTTATSPDGGTLTYQWQRSTSGSYRDISGATGSSYTTPSLTLEMDGSAYRCKITNTKGGLSTTTYTSGALLTVNRLTATVTITGDPAKTYDGTAVSNPAATTTSDATLTYAYYSDNNGSIGSLISTPVNAGTYWVRVTSPQTATYSQASAVLKFTIAKASMQSLISLEVYTGAYDGQPHSISLSGVPEGSEIRYGEAPFTYNLSTLPTYTDAGSYRVDVRITNPNYEDYTAATWPTISQRPLTSSMIASITESYTYDGTAKTPSLTVADGSPSIITTGDYTVTYSDNVNAGTATATITATGDGNYSGSASVTYSIGKKTLSSSMIAAITESLTYDGTAKNPSLTVTDGIPSIIGSGDYSVSYGNNIDAGSATAIITATQDGNYSGSASVSFSIGKKALSSSMIAAITEGYTYDGIAKEPVLTVTDGSPSIIGSGDYIVSYDDNINAGTATATITAAEDGNYSGSASVTFTIGKKALSSSMIASITESYTYDETAKTPALTVTDGSPSIIYASDYTISYTDNVNAGTATATITATAEGNYQGSAFVTFTIGKKALSSFMIAEITESLTYDGMALEPELTVTDGDPSIIGSGDYTVSYTDNVNAGIATATITATAEGNYSGSASVTFTIGKKALSDTMIAAIAESLTYNGTAQEPELTVTDGSPSIIYASDYTISYGDNTSVGTATATITATEEGNYSGSASVTFTIGKKPLSDSMIAAITESLTYNGEGQEPELTVADGNPSILAEKDYTVSYTDNVDAGTATATITARSEGNYSGSASVTYTIGKKPLSDGMTAAITEILTYNGTFQEPELTVADGSPSILQSGDYAISYQDNFNAGTGTAIITATEDGNYMGQASVTFTIGKKALSNAMIRPILAIYTYDATAKEPLLDVRDGNPSIIRVADYTVRYLDNVQEGTAYAVISARADGNYVGSASAAFTILPAPPAPVEEDGAVAEKSTTLQEPQEEDGFSWIPIAVTGSFVFGLAGIIWNRRRK